MEILHIIPYYKPSYIYGGPVVSVSQLCENQAKLGHRVEVFTTTANGDCELNKFNGKPQNVDGVLVYYFIRLTKNNTFFAPSLFFYLIKNIKRYDIIHVHSWWNTVAVFSVGICLMFRKNTFLSPRGMLSDYSFKINNSLTKKIIHYTFGKFFLQKTIVHAASKIEEEIVQNKIAPKKLIVLPNIIELPLLKKNFTHSYKTFNIVFLSRIHHIKGLEILFEALKDLPFDYTLKIAGSGDPGYITFLKEFIGKLGLEKNVIWEGWIYGQKKYDFLEENDLFILPSHSENFANCVIESLYAGTPVLVSNKVGLSDYVLQKDLGWISGIDIQELRDRIILAYSDVSKRKRIRKTAPEIIKNDFSGKKVAMDYICNYKQYVN